MTTTCKHCGATTERPAARASIHGMYDCHLFHPVRGRTVDEVIAAWLAHNAQPHPARFEDGQEVADLGASMLCPIVVLDANDRELRRVGPLVQPNRKYYATPEQHTERLAAWRQACLDDPDIPRLLAGQSAVPQQSPVQGEQP